MALALGAYDLDTNEYMIWTPMNIYFQIVVGDVKGKV